MERKKYAKYLINQNCETDQMETTGQSITSNSHQHHEKKENCSCSPIILVYLFSTLTMISGITIIVWWVIYAENNGVSIDIVDRKTWNAQPPDSKSVRPLCVHPPTHVVIMHTGTNQCFNLKDCSQVVRDIQKFDMYVDKRHDIIFNFLIGNDGLVYEGRGWGVAGLFSNKVQDMSVGIAIIGDYEKIKPSGKVLKVCQLLIEESVRRKKLDPNFKLIGLRQVQSIMNPGKNLFESIQNWKHWTDCSNNGCLRRYCGNVTIKLH